MLARDIDPSNRTSQEKAVRKELDRKDAPEVGGGSVTNPTLPGVPIITPTYPVPGYPQVPAPGIDPTGSHEKY